MVGYNNLNTANNVIKTGGNIHAGFAVSLAAFGFINPASWVASALHGVAAVTWRSTSAYIENGLDYDHAILVGAYRVDKIERRVLFVKWVDYIKVPEPHDGVVPVKSQQLNKSRGNNVMWGRTVIKGVNHMEQRNHPNTRAEFDMVFKGIGGYDHVFRK